MQKIILLALFSVWMGCLYAQTSVVTDPKTGKTGLIHPLEGYTIIPFLYDEILPSADDTLVTVKKGADYGLFTHKGRAVLPVTFEAIDISWRSGMVKSGFVAAQKEGKWGLYNLQGQRVLPHAYEYVRPLWIDMVVARLPSDTFLQFFNGRGEPLFKQPGQQAKPGFDPKSIEITKADRSYYFCNRSGGAIFPNWAVEPQWTDGRTIICGKRKYDYIFEWAGLLTWTGDTLLPCIYQRIEAVGNDRFIVTQKDLQRGVCNAQGQWLIPMAPGELSVYNNHARGLFRRQGKEPFSAAVYDYDGQLLVKDCRLEAVYKSIFWCFDLPSSDINDYLAVVRKEDKKMGLYHADGRLILPFQFDRIAFCANRHPLVAKSNGSWKAYSLDGKPLLNRSYKSIEYSIDPRVFVAAPENSNLYGFVTIGEEEKAVFEYENISLITISEYFRVFVNGKYYLHDPSGKRLLAEGFLFLGTPGIEHFQAWRAAKKPGKLVATATRSNSAGAPWVGINAAGKAFAFPAIIYPDTNPGLNDTMLEEAPRKGQ